MGFLPQTIILWPLRSAHLMAHIKNTPPSELASLMQVTLSLWPVKLTFCRVSLFSPCRHWWRGPWWRWRRRGRSGSVLWRFFVRIPHHQMVIFPPTLSFLRRKKTCVETLFATFWGVFFCWNRSDWGVVICIQFLWNLFAAYLLYNRFVCTSYRFGKLGEQIIMANRKRGRPSPQWRKTGFK